MGEMAKKRWQHVWWAIAGFLSTLLAVAILQPGQASGTVLRGAAIVVSLLVAIDIFGEAKGFQRGEVELGKLLALLVAEGKNPDPAMNEVTRIFIEYNCVLAELPMVPDEVYKANIEKLNAAWSAFQSGIPALNPTP